MALELQTTDRELHEMAQTVDGARPSSSTVRVSKEALRHLIRDHHELYTIATRSPVRREEITTTP